MHIAQLGKITEISEKFYGQKHFNKWIIQNPIRLMYRKQKKGVSLTIRINPNFGVFCPIVHLLKSETIC